MPVRAPDVVGNFLSGVQARQQHDYGRSRNALAQMDLENAPREMQARNRLLDAQVQSAEQGLGADKAKLVYTRLRQALDSGNPRAFIQQQIPDLASKLQQQGIDLQTMDDAAAADLVSNLARKYAGEAGIAPAAPAGPMSLQGKIGADVRAGYLTQEQGSAALNPGMSEYQRQMLDIQRQRLSQPKPGFRTLTPEEIQRAGLPAGTSAQMDETTGKIDVLTKRDNTGVLSQKDATTAKQKLTTVRAARQQLARIKAAYAKGVSSEGGPTNAFGPVQGLIATQQGKSFDAAVDQMRSTLTALTRVPGVGAMSDYETKLDQSKFPKRTEYESVTAEKIQGIEDLLSAIESGYKDLLSGNTPATEQTPDASASSQPEITATGPNGQKVVLRNGQWVPM